MCALGDLAARLGGDEFVVVLGPTVQAEQAQAIAARIITALNEPYQVDGVRVMVGASAGLAFWPADGQTGRVIARADRALYAAKAAGGSRCELATPVGGPRQRAGCPTEHVAA